MDGIGAPRGAPSAADAGGVVDDADFEAAFREHFAAVYRCDPGAEAGRRRRRAQPRATRGPALVVDVQVTVDVDETGTGCLAISWRNNPDTDMTGCLEGGFR